MTLHLVAAGRQAFPQVRRDKRANGIIACVQLCRSGSCEEFGAKPLGVWGSVFGILLQSTQGRVHDALWNPGACGVEPGKCGI